MFNGTQHLLPFYDKAGKIIRRIASDKDLRRATFLADGSCLRRSGAFISLWNQILPRHLPRHPRPAYIRWLHSPALCLCPSAQINELSHVQIPIMLMPDDFKAYSKIKVDNHLFNKWVPFPPPVNTLNLLQRPTNLSFFFRAQGEHAKSFQVQRILPPGVSEPKGALWHWRPGLLGKETCTSTSCSPHWQTHSTVTPLSHPPIFFRDSPVILSFFPLPRPPAVNPRSHCRLWVGSIWRSQCLSSAQLSVSHVYIMGRLAALSGQSRGWRLG